MAVLALCGATVVGCGGDNSGGTGTDSGVVIDASDVGGDRPTDGGSDVQGDVTDRGDVASDGTSDASDGDAADVFDVQCVPSPEVCDGLDNDCNRMADDGLGRITCGVGACERTVDACVHGVMQTCTPAMPHDEVCDRMDNDCNGMVDDGLGRTTCGVGACQHTVDNCVMGVPNVCVPLLPPMTGEVCNGMDDNCDGMVDEGLGSSMCGVGACQRTVDNCVMGVPQTCVPGAPPMTGEVCNGMDDNCNGAIDDDADGDGRHQCETGFLGECHAGVARCVDGGFACVPYMEPGFLVDRCDGLDNDCDGLIDNGPLSTLCPFTPDPMRTVICDGRFGCRRH